MQKCLNFNETWQFLPVFCRKHFFVRLKIVVDTPDIWAAQRPCLYSARFLLFCHVVLPFLGTLSFVRLFPLSWPFSNLDFNPSPLISLSLSLSHSYPFSPSPSPSPIFLLSLLHSLSLFLSLFSSFSSQTLCPSFFLLPEFMRSISKAAKPKAKRRNKEEKQEKEAKI